MSAMMQCHECEKFYKGKRLLEQHGKRMSHQVYADTKETAEMSDRIGRKEVEKAFERLMSLLGKRPAKGYKDVGGWRLDANSTYGGYIVEEIVNEAGGITQPLGSMRMKAQAFYDACHFAEDVIRVYEKSHGTLHDDTQIATLKDSLAKSDAELAKLRDNPVTPEKMLEYLNDRLDEGTWANIGKIKKFGLATVEDSAKLEAPNKLLSYLRKRLKAIEQHNDIDSIWHNLRPDEVDGHKSEIQNLIDVLEHSSITKLEDASQDRAEEARDAHNVEVVGSNPTPATTTGNIPPATETVVSAPVADIKSEPDIFMGQREGNGWHYFPALGFSAKEDTKPETK